MKHGGIISLVFSNGKHKNARVAQLVERDLAKVEAAGSSPVSRSFYTKIETSLERLYFCIKRAHIIDGTTGQVHEVCLTFP